jgi:glycosyltransferase involved in cell wall biosynthesis
MNNFQFINPIKAKLPKVLAVLPGFIPSTQIDVISPLMDLYRSNIIEFRLEVEFTVKDQDIAWCDIVILCRNTEPNAKWFLQVLKLGKPYIYDLDDNFFEIVGDSPEAEYHRSPKRLNMLKEYIRLASFVRVYSEPLFVRAAELNPNVVKVVAPVDFRHILQPNSGSEECVKIVYSTSRSHDQLSDIFIPALQKILDEYGTRVKVYFLGFTPLVFQRHSQVKSVRMNLDYAAYLRTFSSTGYDIGLAPLIDDIFHRSKTNNKFREYGAAKIAGIYSNVDVYSSCVTNYETGILVENNTEDWYQAIKTLIDNPSYCEKIKGSAHEYVRLNYSQRKFTQAWVDQIQWAIHLSQQKKSQDYEGLVIFVSGYQPTKNGWVIRNLLQLSMSKCVRILYMMKTRGFLSGTKRVIGVLQFNVLTLFLLLKHQLAISSFLHKRRLSLFKQQIIQLLKP